MTESESHAETPKPIYVQNESSLDKVEPRFLPVLESAKQAYRETFGDDLFSTYLEGSVGRGQYVDGVSDIDTEALVSRSLTDADFDGLDEHRKTIMQQFPWVVKLDLTARNLEDFKDRARAQFILATEGVLLEGSPAPITMQFPPIGPELARFINEGTDKRQQEAHEILTRDNVSPEVYATRARWMAKRGLRLLLGMAMLDQPVYTHTVAQVPVLVGNVIPEKADIAERLGAVRAEPPHDKQSLIDLTRAVDDLYEEAHQAGVV